MGQLSIFDVPLWENYKQNIFVIIREALTLLKNKPDLPLIEDSNSKPSLNRELYFCFGEACRKKQLSHHLPTREGQSPPYEGDKVPLKREQKKPDFYWQFIDHQANEVNCMRYFVVECKRLGHPTSPKWKLNENYIHNGICRFIIQSHEYGKGDEAGGMIGYIQNMDFDDILTEINTIIEQTVYTIHPLPSPTQGWQTNGISKLEHQLERSFPKSPFTLHHFWVDLR